MVDGAGIPTPVKHCKRMCDNEQWNSRTFFDNTRPGRTVDPGAAKFPTRPAPKGLLSRHRGAYACHQGGYMRKTTGLRRRVRLWINLGLALTACCGLLLFAAVTTQTGGQASPHPTASPDVQPTPTDSGGIGASDPGDTPSPPGPCPNPPACSGDPTDEPTEPASSTPPAPGVSSHEPAPVVTQTVLVVGGGGNGGSDLPAVISAAGSFLAGLAAFASFAHAVSIRRAQQQPAPSSDPAPPPTPGPAPDASA